MTSTAHRRLTWSPGATLTLHPQDLTAHTIVDAIATHRSAPLQEQYEGAVLSLVVHDLATAAPAAGETAVMTIVTEVWDQAEQHAKSAITTSWAHLSWFVQNAVQRFAAGLLPQTAGC
ncbi:hypothetical protein [Kitasatospora griseola]|uniref:hypothetical protein n=1 Tax=Kitasatospora griseola TaxID=2064 RepID=UPI0036505B6E